MSGWNYEDGLHGIQEEASVEVEGITQMWSLLPETDNPHNTFLVLSFICWTRVLLMNFLENVLEEIEVEGFNSAVETLHCHYAVHDQLVQVTQTSVRLVDASTRKLRYEWQSATFSISIATCNATQVLLAGVNHLAYLEIGDGILNVVKTIVMDVCASCLDISPVGDNPHRSQIAAVGTWMNMSARIFSLPELDLLNEEPVGEEAELGRVPRYLLMCSFERIPYLLCGFCGGRLVKFILNTSNGLLMNKEEQFLTPSDCGIVSICPISSHTNTNTNTNGIRTPFAFVTSDQPTVMYSRNDQLIYKDVKNLNVNTIHAICSLHSAAIPYSLAIAGDGKLFIFSMDQVDHGFISKRPVIMNTGVGETIAGEKGVDVAAGGKTIAGEKGVDVAAGGKTGFLGLEYNEIGEGLSVWG